MKQLSLLSSLSVLVMITACEIAKPTSGSEADIKSDSLVVSDSIVPESPASTPTPLPSTCAFDSVEFQRQYGQGLILLKYHGFPFTVYAKPDTNSPSQLLTRSEVYYREVVVSGQPDGYFQWYQSPNEMEDGLIVRTNDPAPDAPIRIRLNDQDKDWWLVPDTSIAYPSRNYHLFSWPDFLESQIFVMVSGNNIDNPLRSSPTDSGDIVPYPDAYHLYSVTDVQLPWIQVNHLIDKNGVYGNDKWSEPIGWMRWICDGEESIDILDPFELEGFYAEE